MQLPGYFWAFSFELTIVIYFNKIECWLYTTMTSLWRNVSDNDNIVNVNDFFLLISAPKVHRRVKLIAARWRGRFNKVHDWVLHALHRAWQCLSTMPPRELSQMLEKEQWPPNNSPNLNGMELSCLGSDAWSFMKFPFKAQDSFWIKNCTGEDIGQFLTSPIDKAFPSYTWNNGHLTTWVREQWWNAF